MKWSDSLDANGYVLMPGVFSQSEVARILSDWDSVQRNNSDDPAVMGAESGIAFAARNLLRIWPGVGEVLRGTVVRDYLVNALGADAGIVRGLFFDKPPGKSWALPWHKDYMIAVKAHGREGVFTNPGTTAGVPQVKAPRELLETMLTARVHLDDMDEDNGPLRVVPGSHRHYAMAEDDGAEAVTIVCGARDVLLMRPLLTHASGRSKPGNEAHRRILHLECAPSVSLADGYEWRDFVSIEGL